MPARREFLSQIRRGAAATAASLAGLSIFGAILKRPREPRQVYDDEEPEVLRPPGALPESQFLAQCIRCVRCIEACPSGAIRLAGAGDRAAPGTPLILASDTACALCLECTGACPTEALTPLTQKREVRMGIAVVDERTCVSHNGTGVCGACHTACPLRNEAITQGPHNAPTVHTDFCVGCGLCEEACIINGIKAIRVFSGRHATSSAA